MADGRTHDGGGERPPGTGRRNRGIPLLGWIIIAIMVAWIALLTYSAWT